MSDPKNRIIDACLQEVLGDQSPPDLSASILSAWSREQEQPSQQTSNEGAGVEHIIDVCLEEVVGGNAAPDLAQPILRQWHSELAAADRSSIVPPSSCNSDGGGRFISPPDMASRDTTRRGKAVAPRSGGSIYRAFARWAIVASVLAIGTFLGFTALKWTRPGTPPINETAQSNPDSPATKGTDVAKDQKPAPKRKNTHIAQPGRQIIPPFAKDKQKQPSPGVAPRTPAYVDVTPETGEAIVQRVNQLIAARWQEVSLKPVGLATDDEWCRRVYLRLLGRIPTAEELAAFSDDESEKRRERLVDRILSTSVYSEAFQENWAEIWTNILIGRSAGSDGLASRAGLRQYLLDAIAANKPYDEMAFELISAKGASTAGEKDFNGAVNFILASMVDKQGVLATSRTAKVFLGRRINCVQCHDHPSKDSSQREFWQANAFFRQLKANRRGKSVVLRNVDFVKSDGVVFYEQKDGQVKATYPVFPDGREAPRTGKVAEFDRRTEFAGYVKTSPDLSRALVNRMWAHFFGYGFTKPVDDMHHNQPSHPELLDYLASQFAANGYDSRELMKWLVLSEPFGISSKVPEKETYVDVPEFGQPRFSRYYARPMKPEEVYRSLVMVANGRKDSFGGDAYFARQQGWMNKFMKNRGTDEGEELNQFNGINAAADLMSGKLMREATSVRPGSLLHSVITGNMSNDRKVEHLFAAAVARKPTRRERDLVRKMIKDSGDASIALQDIWWALLNSNEFILDH